MRRRGVGPDVHEGTEPRLLLGNQREHIEQVAGAPRQAVEPGHHKDVALTQNRERFLELGAIRLCAACEFPEDFLGTSLGKLRHLRGHILTVC
jgi:hypothetical protein